MFVPVSACYLMIIYFAQIVILPILTIWIIFSTQTDWPFLFWQHQALNFRTCKMLLSHVVNEPIYYVYQAALDPVTSGKKNAEMAFLERCDHLW